MRRAEAPLTEISVDLHGLFMQKPVGCAILPTMEENRLTDSQLAAIFLEASFRHEQATATCLEEVGDVMECSDPRDRALVERALMHAERAAACAADAAGVSNSPDTRAAATRALMLDRLVVHALRTLLIQPTES
jgi:hypothetical protein